MKKDDVKKADKKDEKKPVKKVEEVLCGKCGSSNVKKNGFFEVNEERVQKYLCLKCENNFSEKTDLVEAREKRPELNEDIVELYKAGMSQKAIAAELGCSKRTVQVKLKKYLTKD